MAIFKHESSFGENRINNNYYSTAKICIQCNLF